MKITQQQFDRAQQIFHKRSLSVGQKKAMLASVYGDSLGISSPVIKRAMPSPYWSLFQHKTLVGFATLFVFILGTTYASAQSLPGDVLYGVKVRVLEPAVSLFKFSSESKIEYNRSLLEKRAGELRALEAEGSISEKASLESAAATRRIIETLEPSDVIDNPIVEELLDVQIDLDLETEAEVEEFVPTSDPLDIPQESVELEAESGVDVLGL